MRGEGLVFNSGERVEGYSNFLWVLLAAGSLKIGLDPLTVTAAVGVVAYLATLALAAVVAIRFGTSLPRSGIIGLALASLLVISPGFASFSGTGLETSFVGLLIVVNGVVHHVAAARDRVVRALQTLVPLLLVLTRLDTALALLASSLVLAFCSVREGRPLAAFAREFAARYGLAACGIVIYLAWKRVYYGEILPNTYYAKAADGIHVEEGLAYLATFVQSYPSVLVLTLFSVAGLFMADKCLVPFLLYGVIATALHVAYVIKVGGDFMEYRFMWEIWPLLVCTAIVATEPIAERAYAVAAVGAVVALLASGTPTILEKKYGMQSLPQMNGYAHLGERVGTALGRALPAGTVASTTLAGMAYFMPDVTTIDQWGLNDRFTAHIKLRRFLEVDGFNARGHLKYAPLSYLRSRGVNLYVEHPTLCECDRPCREGKTDVFVRLDGGRECVRTWYLTQTPDLTRYFCSHPDLFVLDGVSCSGG